MKTLWQEFTAWLKAKGGVLHCLVIVYLAALGWFVVSPAFHVLVLGLWVKFPSILQTVIEAIMQILAIYGIGSAAKVTGQKVMAKFNKGENVQS